MGGELFDQGWRDRHLPTLVSLGGAEDLAGTDEGDGLGDHGASAAGIQPPDAQGGELAEADAGVTVSEEQHDAPVVLMTAFAEASVLADRLAERRRAGLGESLDLRVGEVLLLLPDHARGLGGHGT